MEEETVHPELYSRVEVRWYDIVTWGGWTVADKMVEECQTPHLCVSVGFLTHDAPDFIVLSATQSANGKTEYNQHVTIPKGCIVSLAPFAD